MQSVVDKHSVSILGEKQPFALVENSLIRPSVHSGGGAMTAQTAHSIQVSVNGG